VIGAFEGSPVARRPANPVKESAGDEHRLNADEEAEHPANLGPGLCANEKNGRAGCEDDRAGDVEPTAKEWSLGRTRHQFC